ncbi:MAG: NAD(P)H-dependent oxidoreductase [Roseibium sp.]|uniref:NADPH-dependent FMN reductase n=1 Tax=Roseibium sp. TaxID=1936156 RepID=UPI00263A350A|nr:NAD(P)H-dependent oxidoreductase [Roseibium sp.]MCV0427153.1 NAD(P)H-dependent oxidoreductase [Roseibium sp.]
MRFLIFVGSERDSTPPRPARLGLRVVKAIETRLSASHVDFESVDPLQIDLPPPFKPHFSYARGKAPDQLDELARKISEADGYVMTSPEYNHSMSPTLAHLLNHFGSSLFSYKPSAIVTYSAGQWGGARAAVNMRSFLSELGCLPVSAMIHVPKAQEVFDETGSYLEGIDPGHWDTYLDRTIKQLFWWAEAAKHQRRSGSIKTPEAFTKAPSQRNAPG